jgi:hypothetical protein
MEWWPYPKISAPQMAALSVTGALLAAGSWVVMPHLFEYANAQLTPARILLETVVPLAAFVIGSAVWLHGILQLGTGIKRSSWPEAQIESLRTITQSPVLVGLFLIFFGIFCFSQFSFSPHPAHPQLQGVGWAAFILGMCCSQLRSSTQRPRTPPTTRIDWRSRPPIHSDHWGQR